MSSSSGDFDGATFDAHADATRFKALVEVHGQRKYLERLRVHVLPGLGERPIVEITRREIRVWQEGLLAKGLSPKTIQNVRGETVSPIVEAACLPGEDDELPLRTCNPLKGLKLPERA